jgi:hypothetical protein
MIFSVVARRNLEELLSARYPHNNQAQASPFSLVPFGRRGCSGRGVIPVAGDGL